MSSPNRDSKRESLLPDGEKFLEEQRIQARVSNQSNERRSFNVKVDSFNHNLKDYTRDSQGVKDGFNLKPPGILDLCKHPRVLKDMLITSMFFFCTQFNYWGSIFGLEALKGDLYFNSFFGAVADAIGGFMIEPATKNFKRKTVFLVTFGITIVAASGFIFVEVPQECIDNKSDFCWQKVAQLSFAATIRLTMQVGNGVTNLYVNEVFPSVYRGIGVGVSFMIGGLGNMLAPFVSS